MQHIRTMNSTRRLCHYCKQSVSKSNFYLKHRNGSCQNSKYAIKLKPKTRENEQPSTTETRNTAATPTRTDNEGSNSGQTGMIYLLYHIEI